MPTETAEIAGDARLPRGVRSPPNSFRSRRFNPVATDCGTVNPYVWLAGAIVSEVAGTTILKLSDGLQNTVLGVVAVGLYVVSFYFVSLALTELPVGLVYATWSAVGIVGLALIGVVYFGEQVDLAAVVGIALVIGGIVLLNVYSEAYNPT